MTFETIQLEYRDRYTILTLNRRNEVIHLEMRDALLRVPGVSVVRRQVLAGAGRAFVAERACPGGCSLERESSKLGESLNKRYNPLVRTQPARNMPVVRRP